MKLAAAQISTVAGNVGLNLRKHIQLTELAVANGISVIFFPELSLTGYEPGLARQLAIAPTDPELNPLEDLSRRHGIVIAAGAPVQDAAGVKIGMIVFQPDAPRSLYAKQHLHADELPFFVAGREDKLFCAEQQVMAPAICYESLQPGHAEKAAKAGATLYLASVAKSNNGVNAAYVHYPAIAKKHGMTVMMANSTGPSDNFLSAGQSGIWNSEGDLVIAADPFAEVLVVWDTDAGKGQLISASTC
ncbi:carbon-nitrogen hydrolase family protein [Erwinia papayae]|uniref:Carbon-nitrogen hydrolase family protein n=1 Tax=Erwinia papayae TaxID=206499 RepID=A0ABV3N5A7_9GAMM